MAENYLNSYQLQKAKQKKNNNKKKKSHGTKIRINYFQKCQSH